MDMAEKALREAIEIAGSQRNLAADCGVAPPSITGWILRGRVPADRVLDVEAKTGVPRHRLRPDLYPTPAEPA